MGSPTGSQDVVLQSGSVSEVAERIRMVKVNSEKKEGRVVIFWWFRG